jgi:hypothetical protein
VELFGDGRLEFFKSGGGVLIRPLFTRQVSTRMERYVLMLANVRTRGDKAYSGPSLKSRTILMRKEGADAFGSMGRWRKINRKKAQDLSARTNNG